MQQKFNFKMLRALAAGLFVVALAPSLFAQKEDKKVAVATFLVDRKIDVSDLSGDAAMIARVLTMADDTNFNLKPVMEAFKAKFFDEYVKHFPFAVMPENEVLENAGYKAYDESAVADRARPLVPAGYKKLYPGGLFSKKENRDQNEMLKIFPEAAGVMFVYMDYGFYKKAAIGNTGTAGIRAVCHIVLYDRNGKQVFHIMEGAGSKKSVAIVGGTPIMDVKKVLPLCQDASQQLLEDLADRMPKIVKKYDGKL